eukprot:2729749-Amphidinium_carterae.1
MPTKRGETNAQKKGNTEVEGTSNPKPGNIAPSKRATCGTKHWAKSSPTPNLGPAFERRVAGRAQRDKK